MRRSGKELLDDPLEIFDIEWLGEVASEPRLVAALHILGLTQTGECDQRYGRAQSSPYLTRDGITIDVG